jgi:hypothetical protein
MWKLRLIRLMSELRAGGFRKTMQYVLRNFIRHSDFLAFEINVDDLLVNVAPIEGVSVRSISKTEQDIDKLIHFWVENYIDRHPLYCNEKLVRKLITDRLLNGEICFVAESNAEIQYFHWISLFNKCKLNKNMAMNHLLFEPGRDAISYGVFAKKDFRGKGIMIFTYHVIAKFLFEKNIKKIIAVVGVSNLTSIKNHKKIGKHTMNIHVTQCLDFKRIVRKKV